jgi:SAM-dependent methyltransferase
MGISKAALALFLELRSKVSLGGSICQLGRQSVDVTPAQWRAVARKLGVPAFGAQLDDSKPIDDSVLFHALGFDKVESLDYSDYEGATHIADFNQPLPEHLAGSYDVVFDGGTTEHIFNLPESFRNIYRLLKPGGLAIHEAPSSNHVDHGFYMFSPTLFYDWYTANRFDIVQSYVYEYSMDYNKPWTFYEYRPGSIDAFSFVGLGAAKRLGIWFVARKTAQSTCDVIPQQGMYLRAWQPAAQTPVRPRSRLRQFITRQKVIRSLLVRLYPTYRRIFRQMPRVVSRH